MREKKEKEEKTDNSANLRMLSKSSVWDLSENDIFRIWKACDKEADLRDYSNRYLDNIRTAFDVEFLDMSRADSQRQLENRGFLIGELKIRDSKVKLGIKKHSITKVTDFTYENIRHISVQKLLEVIENNFGGGWESISQSIRDIIESGFDISTSTMPKSICKGGMYRRKVEDGFEVLQIEKGNWVESIFAKVKPQAERLRFQVESRDLDSEEDDDADLPEIDDRKALKSEFDDESDDVEPDMTEDNYRTTFELDEDPEEGFGEIMGDDDEY